MNTHLSKEEGKKGTSFLVYVKADSMFLSLWVDGNTAFSDLDYFLRAIWLECCGHLSSFTDRNGFYKHPPSDDFWGGPDEHEVPFKTKASKVFEKGKKLEYQYDFGSTTYLEIQVKYEYNIKAPAPIQLLSRNEPLKLLCDTCGKAPAVEICSVHLWEGEGFLCENCSEGHEEDCEDFADYASMSVVNSPRMGICAYEGGSIDTERDGIYETK